MVEETTGGAGSTLPESDFRTQSRREIKERNVVQKPCSTEVNSVAVDLVKITLVMLSR